MYFLKVQGTPIELKDFYIYNGLHNLTVTGLPHQCHGLSYKPDMQEVDEKTVKRADLIVTDTPGDTAKEAGDLICLEDNTSIWEHISPAATVALHISTGAHDGFKGLFQVMHAIGLYDNALESERLEVRHHGIRCIPAGNDKPGGRINGQNLCGGFFASHAAGVWLMGWCVEPCLVWY